MREEQLTITCDRCGEQVIFAEKYDGSVHVAALLKRGWQVVRIGFDAASDVRRHLCPPCYGGFVNYVEDGWAVSPDPIFNSGFENSGNEPPWGAVIAQTAEHS